LQAQSSEELIMRIDGNGGAQALPENSRPNNSNAASAEARIAANSSTGQDQAQLSGVHVQIQALTAQALQLPEVRQEKVNALRQVVLGGNYQPSSGQVADALFTHMLVEPAA
jgi:flagellar biosynthesis anti-sigma factor FlgM